MSFNFVGIPVFKAISGHLTTAANALAQAVTLPDGAVTNVTQAGSVTPRPRSDAAGRMTFTHDTAPVVLVDMGDGRSVPLFCLEVINLLSGVPGAMGALADAQQAAQASAGSAAEAAMSATDAQASAKAAEDYAAQVAASDAAALLKAAQDAQAAAESAAVESLSIGTVDTLATGAPATASVDITSTGRVLNLGLPAGGKGDKGDTGPAGVTSATATGLASGAAPTAIVTNGVLALGIPKGDKGDTGPAGNATDESVAGFVQSGPLTQSALDKRYGQGPVILADKYYDPAATDHRPAIQQALDDAKSLYAIAGQATVHFAGARTWIIGSKTQPWTGAASSAAYNDRVLVKEPGVSITSAPGATWKVKDNFGQYGALIGNVSDTTYEKSCLLQLPTIDFNARGGNTMATGETGTWTRMGPRFVSYIEGSRIRLVDARYIDADNTNTAYIGANHIEVINPVAIDSCKNAAIWHDHSTIYTSVTVAGGTQTWIGGSYSGGGKASMAAVEIHGGAVSMTPFTVTDYYTTANFVGSAKANLSLVCAGIAATGVLLGPTLWSSTTIGAIDAIAIDNLNIVIDRDLWATRGLTQQLYATGLDVWLSCDAPIKNLKVKGSVYYRPSTKADVSGDYQSPGVRLVTDPAKQAQGATATTGMMIEGVDIDLRIVNPYASGALLKTYIRQGRIKLDIVNPVTSASTVASLYNTGLFVLESELYDLDLDVRVMDTRSAPTATSVMYTNATTSGLRASKAVNATLRLSDNRTAAPMPWAPPSTMTGAGGVKATMEAVGTFTAPVGAMHGGSTWRNPDTGVVKTMTAYPSGTTWA